MFTVVAAPQAAPPFHSLIRAATTNLDGEAGWERGLTYAPETPGGYRALAQCSSAEVDRRAAGAVDVVEYEPWYLLVEHPCHTLFGVDPAARDAETRRALDNTESYAIARELWTGEVTRAVEDAGDRDRRNLALTDGPEVLNGGTPLAPARALGLIEQHVGDRLRGGRAYLHCARTLLPLLPNVTREGNLLTSQVGDLIVADAGYTGSAPGNVDPADGVAWLYATGPVVVRRGTVQADGPQVETVDTTTNTDTRRVGRPVAATFDRAAHLAVAVTLP